MTTSTKERLLLGGGILASLAAAITPIVVVPSFLPIFRSFGIDKNLPFFSHLYVDYHPVALCLPLLVLAAWFFWPTRSSRAVAAFILGFGSLIVSTPIGIAALYYPVWAAASG